jgi:ADP-heptose:LPS heptosyltransferase
LSPTGRPRADAPRKILLLRLRRLGDVILTTPAITLLKQAFPGASLTYLVEEPFRRLVEGNPHLDRVLAVPARQGTADLLRVIRSIRRDRYDVLLDFHGGPRASWITLLGGARLKVGYAIKTKGFLYDIRVPRSGAAGPVHSVENHANLVRALGIDAGIAHSSAEISRGPSAAVMIPGQNPGAPAAAPPLCLPEPTEPEKERVATLLNENSVSPAKMVVLHVGAGNRFRDWSADNLAALTGLLVREGRARVALVGAAGDRPVEERILAALGPPPSSVLSFCGRLNLMETRELIRRAALFAGPDSGPMHLAASTSTPIVAWFGPTLPENFAPWRPQDKGDIVLLERSLACRPCEQRTCLTADYRCLQTITPGDVFEACRRFLV